MADETTKMTTDKDKIQDIAIANIGNTAGLSAGFYKGRISLRVKPKKENGGLRPISTIVSNIFGAWWQARGTGVAIIEKNGKTKIRTTDNLPSDIATMDRFWTIDKVYERRGNLKWVYIFMNIECRNSVDMNRKTVPGLQQALNDEGAFISEHNFVTHRVRDVGFFTRILTRVADIPYRMGVIKAVIERYAENDQERSVKFGVYKRNV